jgi:methyl-accepting chemotaxis protein
MGLVFPLYAQFFVEWKSGMQVWFNLGCLIAGATIGVINFMLVKAVLLRKLQQISLVANAISNNDISHQCTIRSSDIIGEIINSFNRMAGNLREMISGISAAAERVDTSAHEMQTISEHTEQTVEHQKNQTDQVSIAIEQMTESVQYISTYTKDASRAAKQADDEAANGHMVVDKTSQMIDTLAKAVEHGGVTIRKLQRESDNIGTVLDVIKGIAEQTNLLALNAAIEAARAGEQGRGFAVVADEVRSLASRTQESTQEIQQMIERLQSGATEAVQVMDTSHEYAQKGVEQANEANNSLQAISTAVGKISYMNLQIEDAAERQQIIVDEINSSVIKISEAARSSVDGVHMTTNANAALIETAAELRNITNRFNL